MYHSSKTSKIPGVIDDPDNLRKIMSTLFNDDQLSDVTFEVADKSIHCNRCVLGAWSEVWRSMFTSEMKESSPHAVIPIDDISYEDLKAVVRYLYTGSLHLTERNVTPILAISHRYAISQIHKRCSKYIRESLNTRNCAGLLFHACQHRLGAMDEPLFVHLIEYMTSNFEDACLSPDFNLLDGNLVLSLVQKDELNVSAEVNGISYYG